MLHPIPVETVETTQDEQAIRDLVMQLEAAWNAGDSTGYAQPFEDNADFINVMGMHAHGRTPIEAGHRAIFDSLYKGSQLTYAIEAIRFIRADVAVALLRAQLVVRDDTATHTADARPTVLLVKEDARWRVTLFQNTYITAPGAPRQ